MKKLLGVALMLALCASSAFALAAPQRVQGLRFGTWTPQGFVAEADTTFLNGASANTATATFEDTTDAFVTANCDWGSMGYDANGVQPVFRVWVSGSFVSVDSVFVNVEQSYDKYYWFGASNNAAIGGGPNGFTRQSISVPFIWAGASGSVVNNPTGHGVLAAPYARFIVKVDGNTAARMAATKVNVAYRDVRDSAVPLPQMVTKKIQWGSFSANGFNVVKDTSSVTFSAPDTTQWFSGSDMASGPANGGPLVADSTMALGNITLLYTDPSTSDSIYIQQETSPNKSEVCKVELVPANNYGVFGCAVTANATGIDAVQDKTTSSINFGVSHPTSQRQGGADLAPFLRFIVRAGASGEVAGGAFGWVTYWRVPRK